MWQQSTVKLREHAKSCQLALLQFETVLIVKSTENHFLHRLFASQRQDKIWLQGTLYFLLADTEIFTHVGRTADHTASVVTLVLNVN